MYSIILLKQVEHSIILLKVLWHSQLAITFSPSILEFFWLSNIHQLLYSSIQFHDGFRTGFFWHCSKPIDCRWNGLVAYSWWWWSSRGQTVFFLVETDFLSITHVQTHTSQWTHWLAFCRSRLPQPQMSWSSRLHSHQLKNLDFTKICFPWTFQWKKMRHQEAIFSTVNISVKFACTVCNHLYCINSRAF